MFLLVTDSVAVNPTNVNNLKQVGRSLFLLGKHKGALEVYEEALRLGNTEDWEVWHNQGLCFNYLKKPEEAKEAFMRANSVQRHDSTFLQVDLVHCLRSFVLLM